MMKSSHVRAPPPPSLPHLIGAWTYLKVSDKHTIKHPLCLFIKKEYIDNSVIDTINSSVDDIRWIL